MRCGKHFFLRSTWTYPNSLKGGSYWKCVIFSKLLVGLLTSCNAPLMYKPCSNYLTRYTHLLTLLQPQTSSISPFSYTVAVWNRLPYSVVTLPSIRTRKSIVNYLYNLGIHYTNSHRYFMYPLCVSCTKFHRKNNAASTIYESGLQAGGLVSFPDHIFWPGK